MEYYVYAYINKKTGLPYYIGKGKDDRAYAKHGRVKVPKDKSKIVFCETGLTNVGACAIERRLIKWYGRRNIDDYGILLNIQEGGDGAQNVNHSKETRQKISESHKGKTLSKATRNKLSEVRKNKSFDYSSQSQTQKDLLKLGIHNFTDCNETRVNEGTHNWQDAKEARKRNLKRIENGTHNFLNNKGTVNVVDPIGNTKRIGSADYKEQKNTGYYVSVRSYEGQQRLRGKSHEAHN